MSLYSQNFESDSSPLSLSGFVSRSTNYARGGSYSLHFNGYYGGTATRSITVSGPATVSWWYLFKIGDGTQTHRLYVDGQIEFSDFENSILADEVWLQGSYTLPAAGTYSLEWWASADTDQGQFDGVYVDDILIELDGITLPRVSETDTARALGLTALGLGRVLETSSPRALGVERVFTLPRTAQTDAARPLAASEVHALGRVTETGSARAVATSQSKALSRASATESARPLSVTLPVPVPIGRPSIAESARTLAAFDGEVYPLGRVAETGSVRPLAVVDPLSPSLSRATGTETARPLTVQTGSILPQFYRYLAG